MREAEINRTTRETDIQLSMNVDGSGQTAIQTGIGFLDHMLTLLAFHGLMDLSVTARGDLHVDAHHTVEDCALVLGQALNVALGERRGLTRIASVYVPMDDALGFVAIDLSGRSYAVIQVDWHGPTLGAASCPLPTSLVEHFFVSLASAGRLNLHARVLYGRDDHHQAEALFKALGRSLGEATRIDPRRAGIVTSTKGTLT